MGAVPVPLVLTVCGLPTALSVTTTLPTSVAMTDGVKVTLMVQNEPAPREAGQLLVWVKSLLPTMEAMLNAWLPVLVSVTACGVLLFPRGTLPNASEVGDNCTCGPVPVPLNVALCVGTLLVTVTAPPRAPAAVGVKVTLMVQFPPATREAGQLLVCAKSPLAVMVLMMSVLVPEFVSVMGSGELLVPSATLPKLRLGGVKVIAAARPEPVSDTR